MNLKPAFIALTIASSQAIASIIPENTLWIPETIHGALRMSATEFSEDDFINQKKIFENLYPEITFTYNWKDGGVNAFAFGEGKDIEVYISGGLARHNLSSKLVLAQITCHEIGHHFGGAPFSEFFPSRSTERQADYFATTKCMKRYFEYTGLNSTPIVSDFNNLICSSHYESLLSQLTCKKTIEISQELAKLLEDISGSGQSDEHPTPSCRQKIYTSGAFCKNDPNDLTDYCVEGLGTRPNCI